MNAKSSRKTTVEQEPEQTETGKAEAAGNAATAKQPAENGVIKKAAATRTGQKLSIGSYLIQRLQDYGIRDVFGIPGDFVLQFYGMLEDSPLKVIGTTREDCAGYAADGYARVNGMGAVCVTYCVGGLSLCNSIAGAYAEKSAVVVISGAPGVEERRSDPLLHHKVRDFNTQREVFEKITVATALLDDPLTAFREIDRCLEAAARYKRPVYLELPRDRVATKPLYPHHSSQEVHESNPEALAAALKEACTLLSQAQQPVIIAGVEVHRFGLQATLLQFAEKHKLPLTATLLGKSVVSEKHPLYLGVYEGAMGREVVRKYVEESDCILLAGTFMSDINLGIFTARLDPAKCIYVTSEQLRIGYHHFHDVRLDDFLEGLGQAKMKLTPRELPERQQIFEPFVPQPDQSMTIHRLFARLNEFLDENMVVVADVGDSLFGAADLTIYRHTEFLSPAYYTSMGFAIPAALGAQVANPQLRPVVLVGDGAFQMTCLELSTVLRLSYNPIVIVLNNKGYTTERFLQEGPFNDILNWNYHRLPDLLGGGWGFEVRTENELDQALNASLSNLETFSLLNVHLQPHDVSPALQRLADRMSKQL